MNPKAPETEPKKEDADELDDIPEEDVTIKMKPRNMDRYADEFVEAEINEESKFNSFQKFCKLCEEISSLSKYTDKSQAVHKFITADGYDGDVYSLMRLLLPGTDQRVYNMKEKQILKCFADIFDLDLEDLTNEYKNKGDASIVIRQALEKGKLISSKGSGWSIQKIDSWLNELTQYTTDDKQKSHIKVAAKRLSGLEIMYLVRLIKKDLRLNTGTTHILAGLHPSAAEAFRSCRDLKEIVDRCLAGTLSNSAIEIGIKLGTPLRPMLAEACRSVEQAMNRCPNGLFAEIKYDGERVQVHKNRDKFLFFSRSLKPSQPHKVAHIEGSIPKAFANGDDLILDGEVLMVDTNTGKPLPFGTLGIHKKEKFKDARPCLFIFDILRYNDEDLTSKPIKERRQLLEKNMVEIKNEVMFSNAFFIENGDKTKLHNMIWKAIDEGLEGLVLKDAQSKYEPGRRHWLKVKKDYLDQGKLADTADLIVLGAYFGTGSKGGLMSAFLMGVYDPETNTYRTVTRCGNGPTDAQLDKINKELGSKMKRIDGVYENLPNWLRCSRQLVPDFVVDDPKNAPIWEIAGAEFSKSETHTANGISIRFPRLTKVRDDKDWKSATNLQELKKLFETSKSKTDVTPTKENEVPLYAKDQEEPSTTDKNIDEKSLVKSKKRAVEEVDEEAGPSKKKEKVEESEQDEEKTVVSLKEEAKDAEEEEEEEKCPNEKTPCRFGKNCYRKNPEHKKQFWHPTK